MATRNTAKYGSELARLLNALAASPDNIVSTQDTLTDILEKVIVIVIRMFCITISILNNL